MGTRMICQPFYGNQSKNNKLNGDDKESNGLYILHFKTVQDKLFTQSIYRSILSKGFSYFSL